MAAQPGPVPTIISVFRQAAALMIDDLAARLEAAGFTGGTPARYAVFENLDPGGTRLTDLAARAGITHQSMSELVSVLEHAGYLERCPDPGDRRARIVRLTPAGRQVARQAIKEIAAIEDEWRTRLAREGLTGDIVAALTKALSHQPEATAETAGPARPAHIILIRAISATGRKSDHRGTGPRRHQRRARREAGQETLAR